MTEIQVELDDDELLWLALRAHEQNITLNQLIIDILQEYLTQEYYGPSYSHWGLFPFTQ